MTSTAHTSAADGASNDVAFRDAAEAPSPIEGSGAATDGAAPPASQPESVSPSQGGGAPRNEDFNPWRRQGQMLWSEWIKPLMIIALVMFSFRSAVADWNDVPTGSMKPTILEGDRIFINKVAYDLKVPFTRVRLAQWSNPEWGDVIVLRSPEDNKRLVKRVVGLPGDIVEIRGMYLYRNGQPAHYLKRPATDFEGVSIRKGQTPFYFDEDVAGRQHPMMLTMSTEEVEKYRFLRPHFDTDWVRTRTVEAYGKHYTMAWPHEEHDSGRPCRKSPLYDTLKAQGACFGEKLGWERPNWFAGDDETPKDVYSFGRQNWFAANGREHKAAREAAILIDQTSFAKFSLKGPDALACPQLDLRGQCRQARRRADLYPDAE